MTAHRILQDLLKAPFLGLDPGDTNTIEQIGDRLYVPLVSAAAETRTLGRPQVEGQTIAVSMKTDGGDITMTVTGGYDQSAGTTIVFGDVGDFVTLLGQKSGTTLQWRLTAFDGVSGPSIQVPGLDLNGEKLILDADGDTSIQADTDDQIDIEISGADDFKYTANVFTLLLGSNIQTDSATGSFSSFLNDLNGNAVIRTRPVSSAVNSIGIRNASTGAGPIVSSVGETNVSLFFDTAGTGQIVFQLGGIAALNINDLVDVTFAGAAGVAGHDLYMQTQDAGTDGKAGGLINLQTGDGSVATTTDAVGGAGGVVSIVSGAAGASDGSGTGGAGGTVSVTGGAAAAGGTSGNGGIGAAVNTLAGVGGAAGSSSGTGGDGGTISFTPGAAGGAGGGSAGVAGFIRNKGVMAIEMPTPGAVTDAETLAVGEILGGVITGIQSSGSTNALTLPTGTVMDAALPASFVADDSFELVIINESAAAADTYTLTAASGFTIVGKAIIDGIHATVFGSGSATFRCRKTASNTFVAYRIN